MFVDRSKPVKMCQLYDFFGGENGRMTLAELQRVQENHMFELCRDIDDKGCIISVGENSGSFEVYWFSTMAFYQRCITRRYAFGSNLVIG
jgi:hypothetical protein